MRNKKYRLASCLLIGLLTLVCVGHADTFMKQVNNTDAMEMMGQKQPARSDTAMSWFAGDKACMIDAKGNSTVFRADRGVMYMIDNEKKSYAEIPATWLEDAAEQAENSSDSGMAEAMKMMKGMMKFNVTVTPTEETKKIKDWDTKKYDVTIDMGMGKVNQEVWACPDLKIDQSAYMAMSNVMMSMFDGFEAGMEEFKKVKGVPVMSTSEVMMMGTSLKSSSELLEFTEKDAPAGIYDVPEGYTKTDMPNPMSR